ncbi:hypothetical protein KHA96_16225 [Bacillus sp. FJAT-49711]|uniref:hypothetical protein n=1 Tax=Bacillus sp. FJAT-49711 TaxID=2833585 RepID=UPI001BCA3DEC|nr:hypothetical protein [Bacillus sp. FJAT-49711]MBS4219862.1 hypothetical protein [Bacillus sp. FJAT-49711]
MAKKITFIAITISFFGAFLNGYIVLQYKEKKISEAANLKYSEVTKIVFYDGRGKNPSYTVKDKQNINEFEKLLDRYIIKKEKQNVDAKGWIHIVDFYSGSNRLTSITFNNPLEINGKYFDIVEGPALPGSIDEFLESASQN